MKGVFRAIVVVALLLQILWFCLPYTWVYIYEGDALNLLRWSGYGASINLNGPIPYFFLGAYAAISAALIFFQGWARLAFVLLTVVNVIVSPLWGFYVSAPIEAGIGYVVAMADGAIISLAYFTSLSREFAAPAQQTAAADAVVPPV